MGCGCGGRAEEDKRPLCRSVASPFEVGVHSGDTEEDVSFEEVIYRDHLEELISLYSLVLLSTSQGKSV